MRSPLIVPVTAVISVTLGESDRFNVTFPLVPPPVRFVPADTPVTSPTFIELPSCTAVPLIVIVLLAAA